MEEKVQIIVRLGSSGAPGVIACDDFVLVSWNRGGDIHTHLSTEDVALSENNLLCALRAITESIRNTESYSKEFRAIGDVVSDVLVLDPLPSSRG